MPASWILLEILFQDFDRNIAEAKVLSFGLALEEFVLQVEHSQINFIVCEFYLHRGIERKVCRFVFEDSLAQFLINLQATSRC